MYRQGAQSERAERAPPGGYAPSPPAYGTGGAPPRRAGLLDNPEAARIREATKAGASPGGQASPSLPAISQGGGAVTQDVA